ncbi:hypothetical protein VNO77_03792 [Canavalia gladiata]|uniref:Uncharacterized protein n=1 Tax=Canavalia gladiata TaxID=3824 RepID=A0AAN9R8G7_CANGL
MGISPYRPHSSSRDRNQLLPHRKVLWRSFMSRKSPFRSEITTYKYHKWIQWSEQFLLAYSRALRSFSSQEPLEKLSRISLFLRTFPLFSPFRSSF